MCKHCIMHDNIPSSTINSNEICCDCAGGPGYNVPIGNDREIEKGVWS
jgi:hypothetical protein